MYTACICVEYNWNGINALARKSGLFWSREAAAESIKNRAKIDRPTMVKRQEKGRLWQVRSANQNQFRCQLEQWHKACFKVHHYSLQFGRSCRLADSFTQSQPKVCARNNLEFSLTEIFIFVSCPTWSAIFA